MMTRCGRYQGPVRAGVPDRQGEWMSAPVFSVVIPTYNRRDLVPYAVRSVLRQTCGDLEVVVSDNGSSDDTADVIGSIADRRVRYVQTPVHGPIAYSWEFA